MARRVVANKKDALKSVTEIMRDDEIKTAEKMKAAEMIIKYGGEDEQKETTPETGSVMIVDDIPKETFG